MIVLGHIKFKFNMENIFFMFFVFFDGLCGCGDAYYASVEQYY